MDQAFAKLDGSYKNKNVIVPQIMVRLENLPFAKSSWDENQIIEAYFSTRNQMEALEISVADLGLTTLLRVCDKLLRDNKKGYLKLRIENQLDRLDIVDQYAKFDEFLQGILNLNNELHFTSKLARNGQSHNNPKPPKNASKNVDLPNNPKPGGKPTPPGRPGKGPSGAGRGAGGGAAGQGGGVGRGGRPPASPSPRPLPLDADLPAARHLLLPHSGQ